VPAQSAAPTGEYARLAVRDAGPIAVLGDGFAGNRSRVWHRGQRLDLELVGAAESLGSGFLRLGDAVFHWQEVMTSRKSVSYESLGGRLPDVDVASFAVLGENYARDRARVYHRHRATEMDRDSIELLGGGWARDAAAVYCYGYRSEADPDGFRVLGGTRSNRYAGGDHGAFASDGRIIFRGTEKLSQEYGMDKVALDAAAFEVLNEWYGRDGRHVIALLGPKLLDRVDAASFTVLDGPWGRAGRIVVYAGLGWPEHIEDAGAHFEVVNAAYATSETTVFAHGANTSIDRASFRALGDEAAVDKAGVWFGERRIEGADPATVAISALAPGLLQDDRGVYHRGYRVTEVARADACTLGSGYWRAGDVLYHREVKLGSIAADFELLADDIARNGGRVYFEARLLK